jgi:hypothetical protein
VVDEHTYRFLMSLMRNSVGLTRFSKDGKKVVLPGWFGFRFISLAFSPTFYILYTSSPQI